MQNRNFSEVQGRGRVGETIVDLFVEQALKTPGAVAAIQGEECLTYRELHEKSNQLAHRLRKNGVGAEVLVPIFLEPGLLVIESMLGIMKAGGAYVPIDPDYPAERVAYMLEDTACRVIVSSRTAARKLPASDKYCVLLLDEHRPQLAAEPATLPAGAPAPAHLAYVIYTSGSTGKPKGVMVEHAQIHTYMLGVYERMELAACGSYAILGTFSADAGLTAVFAALCSGSSLNIINVKAFANFAALTGYLVRYPIDCYKITPSLIEFFLQHPDAYRVLPRKRLILGGEACSRVLVHTLRGLLPAGCVLFNHYGPTETTVGVITHRFPGEGELPDLMPLGQPLPHVKAHVLDEHLAPVPAGAVGELHIEGPLVARGYLNNGALTARKFVVVPLAGRATRVYKTGDVVRTLPGGDIEYLGRMDDQVKIRGNRIELKEIESVILQSGLVKQCVVQARENKMGVKYLAGYVVPEPRFDKSTLVGLLHRHLPGYMIPGRWVVMTQWPLTFNNKIDKMALPDPDDRAAAPAAAAPGCETEARLLATWQQLLGVAEIGVYDHFFEMGGDSLSLIGLSYEIHRQFGVQLPPVELFGCLTIAQQARYLADKGESARTPGENRPAGFDGQAASLAQKNLFIQHKLNPAETFPNSSITFRVTGTLDAARLEAACTELIRSHESLRTTYYFSKGNVYKRISAGFSFALQHHRCGHPDIDQAVIAVTKPFDFNTAPLIRVCLIELAGTGQYLHVDMPHINSDGASTRLIAEELVARYNGTYRHRDRLQFTNYQQRVHAYVHSARYQADASYWQRAFSGPLPALPLRGTGGVPRASRFGGISVVSPFPAALQIRLHAYVKGKSTTKFQLLLSTYFLFLHKITATRSLAVLVPVLNRDENGLEDVVGLLSNAVLVKAQVPPEASVRDFLGACRDTLLETMRHQQYPFEELLRWWTGNGRNGKDLLNSFFGYHHNRREYRLEGASLTLHIPLRDKENMPLSAAVFETESDLTLRLSCLADAFGEAELKNLIHLYFNLLDLVMGSNEDDSIASVLEEPALAFHQ